MERPGPLLTFQDAALLECLDARRHVRRALLIHNAAHPDADAALAAAAAAELQAWDDEDQMRQRAWASRPEPVRRAKQAALLAASSDPELSDDDRRIAVAHEVRRTIMQRRFDELSIGPVGVATQAPVVIERASPVVQRPRARIRPSATQPCLCGMDKLPRIPLLQHCAWSPIRASLPPKQLLRQGYSLQMLEDGECIGSGSGDDEPGWQTDVRPTRSHATRRPMTALRARKVASRCGLYFDLR